ncbi:assimilatory sulfite reductase (NADPH) flavoprotein subunit [Algicola sagamiensis]|uniref:assimilatory sulfite reductase (NADPH) flavoprotein subunit n=1 Tax=Algicola sagamiensis TaxID=163869 RepID=UPI0003653DC5|nr:assimilatory sulfite reductase (NADPH) flavoprotein subunit [Algicola sagamiensis]
MFLQSGAAQALPLSNEQVDKLQQFVKELSPLQQAWVSGYLAASSQQDNPTTVGQQINQPTSSTELIVLYGSQTGNGKAIAQSVVSKMQSLGWQVHLKSIADVKPNQLKKITHLVLIMSTHGEGEPPEDALTLHRFIFSKKAPDLSHLNYAVLALGDSSYEFFCKAGEDFDNQLANLGATRLFHRVDLDVDYESEATKWETQIQEKLQPIFEHASSTSNVVQLQPKDQVEAFTSNYSKQSPYLAEVLQVQRITGRDSVKEIHHIELSIDPQDIQYQVGDALGVYFQNDPTLISALLNILEISKETLVQWKEDTYTIAKLLQEKLELTQSYPQFVAAYAAAIESEVLAQLAEDKTALRAFLAERQIIDIVQAYPGKISAQAFVDCLRPLTPRLYSIASSQKEADDEVHLTLALVSYEAFGSAHFGGASGFLGKRVESGDQLPIYIEPNSHFRLPQDPERKVIMIGPGTGIAPFRAFLQEKDAGEFSGDMWLFFGNPHFTQDFLYQVEIQDYLNRGILNRIDLAFSRDQQEKIYVQHRLKSQAADVYAWLQSGAAVYVCGDASRMAKDVHQALIEIIVQEGQMNVEQAEGFLETLREEQRYLRDVY